MSEAELVTKTKVDIEDGYIYFVGDDGNIFRIKEVGYPGKKIKVQKVMTCRIKKENGYTYFLNKFGNVYRVFLDKVDIIENKKESKLIKKRKSNG